MLTVLVTNTKGGCGKTTLATGLAGAFANTGFATVLADCDRQRSSLAWADRRSPTAAPVTVLNWSKGADAVPNRTRRLVIDAPAALRRKDLEILIKLSDVVVLPVLPSMFDENATRRFLTVLDKLKPVRKGKRAVAVVGNRIRARTHTAERLETFLDEVGHPTVARLRDSQAYPATAADGMSLFDLRTRRAAELADDWRPLLAFIDEIALEKD